MVVEAKRNCNETSNRDQKKLPSEIMNMPIKCFTKLLEIFALLSYEKCQKPAMSKRNNILRLPFVVKSRKIKLLFGRLANFLAKLQLYCKTIPRG